jgi:hypothetical protein
MYAITLYTKRQAKANNLKVRPSTKRYKKLDVYKNGDYLASVGDVRYADYPTYIETKGKSYADKRRELYHIRHKNDSGIAGKLSKILLW